MGDVAASVLAAAAEQDKQYSSILVEKPLGTRLFNIRDEFDRLANRGVCRNQAGPGGGGVLLLLSVKKKCNHAHDG